MLVQAQNGKTDAGEIDAWKGWQDAAHVPTVHSIESTEELANAVATKQVLMFSYGLLRLLEVEVYVWLCA